MPFPLEHAFRMASPKQFDRTSFRRKTIAPGIDIVMAMRPGKNSMETQAYRFDSKKFTFEEAKKWMDDHHFTYMKGEMAMQSMLTIQSTVMAFERNEIEEFIDPATLASIRARDKSPFFQMYSICHEGYSRPRLIGETNEAPISWPRRAVRSLKKVLKRGVKFFRGHNKDNSTENREPIGEVVGFGEKEIKGRLHSVVVAYHPPAVVEEVKGYDICSQEGIWNFFESAGKLIADVADEITGIALGSSKHDQPAFEGAVRLGMLQAFGIPKAERIINGVRVKQTGEPEKDNLEETKMPTFNEIVLAVRDMNIRPNQLFSFEDLKSDSVHGKEINSLIQKSTEFEKEASQLKSKNDEMDKAIKDFQKKDSIITAKNRFSEILKGAQITEKERAFIEKTYKPETVGTTDAELLAFIDAQKALFSEVVSAIGGSQDPVQIKRGDGSGPVKNDAGEIDYSDPNNNELLRSPKEE